jgi:hypothetical protein
VLVCPSCRSENTEDAGLCRHCGTSLESIGSPMRRIDRSSDEGAESQLELWQPRSPSTLPLIIGAVLLGLGLLGWGIFATLQPDPCIGRFQSVLYPYCTDIPAGWVGGLTPAGDTVEDRFGPPELEGEVLATVRVSRLLTASDTSQYADQFRISQEATGFELSEVDVVTLDGEQAAAWNYSVTTDEETSPTRVREVILVRGEEAWRIQLIATDEAYENARFEFEEMLAGWRWKA